MPGLALKHNFTKLQKAQSPPELSKYSPQAQGPSLPRTTPHTSAELKCSQGLELQLFPPPQPINLTLVVSSVSLHFMYVSLSHMYQLKWFETFSTPCFTGHLHQETFPNVQSGCDCTTVGIFSGSPCRLTLMLSSKHLCPWSCIPCSIP